MQTKRFRTFSAAVVVFTLGCVGITACGSQRPLVVPTTPPSERNENPGPDQQPPASSSASPAPARSCPSAEDCFDSAMRQMEDGDRAGAEAALRSLRVQYPESLSAKRAGFLLGRFASDLGSPEAEPFLLQAMKDLPGIEEYSLFFMANGQVNGKRFQEAAQTYDRLLQKYPDSVLNAQAEYQKAAVFIQAGDCQTAVAELDGFVTRFPKDSNTSKALLQLADCASKLKDSAKAVRALQQIWFYYADSPEAQGVQPRLEQLSAAGVSIPEPSSEAHYQRGRILFDVARYEEAANEFKTLLAAGEPANRDEIRLTLSEALIQLKQYDAAKALLEEVVGKTQSPDHWTAALFWLGRLAVRQGDEERLLQIEKKLADRFPASPERAKLLFLIGDFYEDRKQMDKAVEAYQRVTAEVPESPSAEDAVWRIGWVTYKTGRYADAIKVLDDHLVRHPASSLGGQFGYWIGRSAEQVGQPEKAAQAYREVCRRFLRSFYCHRATARLARLNSQATSPSAPQAGELLQSRTTDGGKTEEPQNSSSNGSGADARPANGPPVVLPMTGTPTAFIQDRHYAAALELMAVRLKPEAMAELSQLTGRYAADKGAILKLAELLHSTGNDYESLRLMRLYFQDVIEKGGDNIPKSFWEQAYPSHVVSWIQRNNPTPSADPYLVAAVIREESGFDPKAISKVGALGLMQLMPYTAEWVAKRVGLKTFHPDLLMDQAVNIQLGAWYLQHLVERFNGNLVMAIASYNAGPDAVDRWAEGGVGDMDEFIESIPFNETRYFTKKVIRSYIEYRRIAGEDSAQRLSRVLISP